MSAFGQSIATVIFVDDSQKMFSVSEFACYLARVLITVGMVPLKSRWPLDISDPAVFQNTANTNIPVVDTSFLFDYPDDSTFVVDGVAYRPCLQLRVCAKEATTYSNGYIHYDNNVSLCPCIRRAGSADWSSVIEINETALSQSPARWRNQTYTSYTQRYMGGSYVVNHTWARAITSPETQYRINARHFLAYLGPAGLFISAGTGTLRSEVASILNVGFIFAGARLPNRAYPSGIDYDLNRINPIIPLFMGDGSAEVWNGVLQAPIHGMQAKLKKTTNVVHSRLFNLENLEWPIYPTYWPYTTPSPRKLASGQGAHILARLVQVPTHLWSDYENKYGPKVDDLTGSEVRPLWEDVFTAPAFRFCDRTAPMGDYEDPVTGTNWYLIPARNTGGMIGLLSESATYTDQVVAKTLFGWGVPVVLNFTGWTESVASAGADRTITYNSAQPVPVSITQYDDTNIYSGWENYWNPKPSVNGIEALGVATSKVSYPDSVIEFAVTPQSTDPADVMYFVTFEALNRHDNNNAAFGKNPVHLEVLIDGTWVRVWTMLSCGNTLSDPRYDLTNAGEFFVPRDLSTALEQLRFRFLWATTDSTYLNNRVQIAGITVVKKRYA